RVGKSGVQILVFETLGVGAVGSSQLAGFKGVERRLAANPGFDLGPGQIGELARHSSTLDQRVPNIDKKLERYGKLVVHQAGGDEDALRVAETQIAMADRAVAQRHVVAVGDEGFLAMA